MKPPFAVAGEAEGLLLVWYDADGSAHTATKRSEIPEAQRKHVRVDSLDVAPDKRLDPAFVYVADLSTAAGDGSYAVRKVTRELFEQAMVKPAAEPAALASNDVILYGASWCGACNQARQYFKQKGVPFVDKDIEKRARRARRDAGQGPGPGRAHQRHSRDRRQGHLCSRASTRKRSTRPCVDPLPLAHRVRPLVLLLAVDDAHRHALEAEVLADWFARSAGS